MTTPTTDTIPTLKEFRQQLAAWAVHIREQRFKDRQAFISWLSDMPSKELAQAIDAEVTRDDLWEMYLRERYGA